MMLNISYTIKNGITHVEIAAGKIYFCAESISPLLKLACSHAFKKFKIFLDGAVAPRAYRRVRSIASVFLELFGSKLAHIGKAFVYKLNGILIGLFKIVRSVVKSVPPIEAEPMNILLNSLNKLGILLCGICIVHTQIAYAAEAFSRAEIYCKRLAVPDMEISVRLRREARMNLHSLATMTFRKIFGYKFINKVSANFSHFHNLPF